MDTIIWLQAALPHSAALIYFSRSSLFQTILITLTLAGNFTSFPFYLYILNKKKSFLTKLV